MAPLALPPEVSVGHGVVPGVVVGVVAVIVVDMIEVVEVVVESHTVPTNIFVVRN